MHCWFQVSVPLVWAEIMECDKEIMSKIGYRYVNENDNKCIEYHVDYLSQSFTQNEIVPNLPFGGKLSI